jgi:hypothetical protein
MSVTDPSILSRLQNAREKKEKKAPTKAGKAKATEGIMSLDEWFKEGDRLSTGKCRHCGGRTCKGDPLYFKHSQAHLLPKRLFPSVATNPLNRIELCFWNNNCHGNYDNGTLDMKDMNCFDEMIEKFIILYPLIDKKERRHIPDVLLQYAKDNI